MAKALTVQTAGELFRTMLNSELDEAETVEALSIAITMRLAYETKTFDELLGKLDKLFPIFKEHARVNIEGLAAAQRAKENANG